MAVFRRQPFEKQERGLRSALGAIARVDPEQVADSYIRRQGGKAYLVARRDGASRAVLDLIRAKLRDRRAK